MIKIQQRDEDIMLSLRFGPVLEGDLIDEVFKTTLIDEAPDELRDLNSQRSSKIRQRFASKNEHLWAAISKTLKARGTQNVELKEELIQVARKEGRHLGLYFVKKVKLLEQPILFAEVRSVFEESVVKKENERNSKNQKQVCRKVMKRLIGVKLVKKIDKLCRGDSKRYYHLTKEGKATVQEGMYELGMLVHDVVAHNFHTMHVEHDAMVAAVGKRIFALEKQQGYKVSRFEAESQIKSSSLQFQYEFKEKWGMKGKGRKYFPDLEVTLVFANHSQAYLIEIDNATQPAKTVLGKTQYKKPMLIVCVSNERIKKLIESFKNLNCKTEIYFTTIKTFKVGGVFGSDYWDFQRSRLIQFSMP